MTRRLPLVATLALGLVAPLLGCGTSEEPGPGTEGETLLGVSCSGKCDGIGNLRSLFKDARNVDVGDLMTVAAGFATRELNDALKVANYGGIAIGEPQLYTTAARARGDLTLKNLDTLVTDLASRFGNRELTTLANRVRLEHLSGSGDKLFGESSFKIDARLGHAWNLATGGFDAATVNLGFDASARLEARVIAAYASEARAVLDAPLRALSDARGFILPGSLDDVKAMKPGESFALKGSGSLGLNLGAGVPFVIANPASLVYELVVSASLRTVLSGQLDVQLVRLDGDQAVLDVGIDTAKIRSAKIALTDGWGVSGLVKSTVALGPVQLDLGKLMDRALQDQLNKLFSFVEARYEKTQQKSRVSVARFRFALDGADGEGKLERALAHALRGDVRLAQTLANQAHPGVLAEFDLVRSGISSLSHAGIDIFGMSFFSSTNTGSGSAVVQTPGGVRTLLFDSLHKESGSFFSRYGSSRVSLSGLVYDAETGELPRGEANLILQVLESDDFMEHDKLLDHLDALILGLAGPEALSALEQSGNALEKHVEKTCVPRDAFDACQTRILTDATAVELRSKGEAAFKDALDGVDLDDAQRALLLGAAKLRLTTQAVREFPAALTGPPTTVVFDYRLDDRALTSLLAERKGEELRDAVTAYMGAVEVKREESTTASALDAARAQIGTRARAVASELGTLFDQKAARYQSLLGAEGAVVAELGQIGPRAIEVRFPVASGNAPAYEKAAAGSLAQARAQVARELYDELVKKAKTLGRRGEQVAAYALLSLTPRAQVEARMQVTTDTDDSAAQELASYRQAGFAGIDLFARGSSVDPIDGGLFSVDALLSLP